MRRRQPSHIDCLDETRTDVLLRKSRRFQRRGEYRRAMLALREVCHLCPDDARLWTLYGLACVRARRTDDARRALVQAIWLRNRSRDRRRAGVTQKLLERIELGDVAFPLKAA